MLRSRFQFQRVITLLKLHSHLALNIELTFLFCFFVSPCLTGVSCGCILNKTYASRRVYVYPRSIKILVSTIYFVISLVLFLVFCSLSFNNRVGSYVPQKKFCHFHNLHWTAEPSRKLCKNAIFWDLLSQVVIYWVNREDLGIWFHSTLLRIFWYWGNKGTLYKNRSKLSHNKLKNVSM